MALASCHSHEITSRDAEIAESGVSDNAADFVQLQYNLLASHRMLV